MEKSQTSGIRSLELARQPSEAERYLSTLALSQPLKTVIGALGQDSELHLVGGTVRDVLLGLEASDFDLTTILTPDLVLERLRSSNIHAIEMGIRHGTIIAVVDGHNIEITTFREAITSGQIIFGKTIEKDLSARDFTINAIAFSISSKKLIDPFNAVSKLGGPLEAPGDAKARFSEDPLRILRMVRFGAAQGRPVSADCIIAATELGIRLKDVSPERIRVEIEKILLSDLPRQAFHQLKDCKLLQYTIPEMLDSVGVEQNEFHVEDVFDHTLSVIERAPKDRLLRWIGLFHDLGKPATLTIDPEDNRRHFYGHEKVSTDLAHMAMERLRFSNDDTKTIANVVQQHMRTIDCGAPGARRIMRDLGADYDLWRAFKVADSPPIWDDATLSAQLGRFDEIVHAEKVRLSEPSYGKLAVNGTDLMELGVKPGKFLGSILKQLEEMVIDNPDLNVKDVLLVRAREIINESKVS